MSNDYLSIPGATLVWPMRNTKVSVYRVNTNGSYTLIGTSSSSSFSIVQYSGLRMKYAISSDSESGYSNVVERYLPLTCDISRLHGSEYLAAAMEGTMTGKDIKTILHTYCDAFASPVFSVAVSDTTKLVDTFTKAYDSTLPVTVVLCKDGNAIDIPASYIQNGELIYFAGSPGAILTYNILDDVSVPNDSTTRVSYYPDSNLVVQNIPGSTTIVVQIDGDEQGVTIAGVNYRLHSSGVMIPFGPNGLMISLVGIGSWVSMTANSCTFSVSGTDAWLTGLNSSTGTLTVPASFTMSGVIYNVLGISETLTNAAFLTNLIFDARSTFTTIPVAAFTGCTNLSSIRLPPGITTIESGAFDGLSNLRTITNLSVIPLTTIGANAFRNCSNLTGTLPSTLTSIGSAAFFGAGGAGGGIVVPSLNLQVLGPSAFVNCGMSGSFDLSRNSTLTTILDGTFTNSTLSSFTISPSITTLNGSGVFNDLPRFTTLFLDVSNVSYLTSAPINCPSFNTIIFHTTSTITTIPTSFKDIMGTTVQYVTLPDSATSIASSAFQNCTSLFSVDLSPMSHLATIGDSAFNGCIRLTSLSLPCSVTDISNNAFLHCSGEMSILFAGLPPVLTASGSLNTASTMVGFYPPTLENQWLPWMSGGLFRNLHMRPSQIRIATRNFVSPLHRFNVMSPSMNTPLSKKALRAGSFPSSTMRTKALAGREMVRSQQSGTKKNSGTYDIHAAKDAGKIYIQHS